MAKLFHILFISLLIHNSYADDGNKDIDVKPSETIQPENKTQTISPEIIENGQVKMISFKKDVTKFFQYDLGDITQDEKIMLSLTSNPIYKTSRLNKFTFFASFKLENLSIHNYEFKCVHRKLFDTCNIHIPKPYPKSLFLVSDCEDDCDEFFIISMIKNTILSRNIGKFFYKQSEATENIQFLIPAKADFDRILFEIDFTSADLGMQNFFEVFKNLNFSSNVKVEKYHHGHIMFAKLLPLDSCQLECNVTLSISTQINTLYSIGFFVFNEINKVDFGSNMIDFVSSNKTNKYEFALNDKEFETLKEFGLTIKIHSFSGGQIYGCIDAEGSSNLCTALDNEASARTIEIRQEKDSVFRNFTLKVSNDGKSGLYSISTHQISKKPYKNLHLFEQIYHESLVKKEILYYYDYWNQTSLDDYAIHFKVIKGNIEVSSKICNGTTESSGEGDCKDIYFSNDTSVILVDGIYIYPLDFVCLDPQGACLFILKVNTIPQENSNSSFYIYLTKDDSSHPISLLMNKPYFGFLEVEEKQLFQFFVHKEDQLSNIEVQASEGIEILVSKDLKCLDYDNMDQQTVTECIEGKTIQSGNNLSPIRIKALEGEYLSGNYFILMDAINPGEVMVNIIGVEDKISQKNIKAIELIDGNPYYYTFTTGQEEVKFKIRSGGNDISYLCEIFGEPDFFIIESSNSTSQNNSLLINSKGTSEIEISVKLKSEYLTSSSIAFTIVVTNPKSIFSLTSNKVYKQTVKGKSSKNYKFYISRGVERFSMSIMLDPSKNYKNTEYLEQIVFHSLTELNDASGKTSIVDFDQDAIEELCQKSTFPCKLYARVTNPHENDIDYFIALQLGNAYSQLYEGEQQSIVLGSSNLVHYSFIIRKQTENYHIIINSIQEEVTAVVSISDTKETPNGQEISPFESVFDHSHLITIKKNEFDFCKNECIVKINIFVNSFIVESKETTVNILIYSNFVRMKFGKKLKFAIRGDEPHYVTYNTEELLHQNGDLEFLISSQNAFLTIYGKFYPTMAFEPKPDKSNNDFVISSNYTTLKLQQLKDYAKGIESGVMAIKTESSSKDLSIFYLGLVDDTVIPHSITPKESESFIILSNSTRYFKISQIDEFNLLISREAGIANVSIFHSVDGSNFTWSDIKAELNKPSNIVTHITSLTSSEIIISKDSNLYCKNCTYFIAINGGLGEFKGTLILNKILESISIRMIEEHLYTEKTSNEENKKFEILADNDKELNIELDVNYGNVEIYIGFEYSNNISDFQYYSNVSNGNKTIFMGKRSNPKSYFDEYKPNNPNLRNGFSYEDTDFNQNMKIYILLVTKKTASLTLSYAINGGDNIKSGVPRQYLFQPGESRNITFWHLDSTKPALNFIKELGSMDNMELSFKFVKYEDYKNGTHFTTPVYPDIHLAYENLIRLTLPFGKGYYILQMKNKNATDSFKINIIYTSLEISYIPHKMYFYDLIPAKNMKAYEILIPGPGHLMFDIYECRGRISISSFSNYDDFMSGNALDEFISPYSPVLRVGSEKILYLKITAEDEDAFVGIRVSHYIHQMEIPFFRFVGIDNDRESIWTIKEDKLEINFTGIYCKDCYRENEKSGEVQYYLASSSNKTQMEFWEKCAIFETFNMLQNYQVNISSESGFQLQFDSTDYQSSLFDKEMLISSTKEHSYKIDLPNKTPYYFQIKAVLKNYFGNEAYFIYEPFELLDQPEEGYYISGKLLFLIYLFAFTAIVLICYFFNKYKKTKIRLNYELQDLNKLAKFDEDTSLEETNSDSKNKYGEMSDVI